MIRLAWSDSPSGEITLEANKEKRWRLTNLNGANFLSCVRITASVPVLSARMMMMMIRGADNVFNRKN